MYALTVVSFQYQAIVHDHTTLCFVASKFGRGKMAENPPARVQQFRDGVGLG